MICNGIDIEAAAQLAKMLTASPQAATVHVHSDHRWENAYAVAGSGGELRMAGQRLPRSYRLHSDLPSQLGGGDTGPTPGELVLHALATCVAGQFVEHAALRELAIDGLEVACEAHADLRGTFDVTGDPPALQGVDITLTVDADIDDATISELLDLAVRTSPVATTLTGTVPLTPAASVTTRA